MRVFIRGGDGVWSLESGVWRLEAGGWRFRTHRGVMGRTVRAGGGGHFRELAERAAADAIILRIVRRNGARAFEGSGSGPGRAGSVRFGVHGVHDAKASRAGDGQGGAMRLEPPPGGMHMEIHCHTAAAGERRR